MTDTPPRLTPERMEAMLARTAEVCMAGVDEAGERMKAAADIAEFERAGRALNAAARGLRQTIAMKLRLDREQAAIAAMRRREAEGERQDAERAHLAAVTRHRMTVRRHFEHALWNENDDDDAQEVFEDLDERLFALSDDEAFLDTPIETLIERLTEEFMVPAPQEDEASDDKPPEAQAAPAAPLFNGRLAPPMDLPSWADEDSS